jgi:hypothetical protein
VTKVIVVCPDHQVHQDVLDPQELMDFLVEMVIEVQEDYLEFLEFEDLQGPLVVVLDFTSQSTVKPLQPLGALRELS